jgi:beta-lactamase regulating signal transducer with metallopeptidase domain
MALLADLIPGSWRAALLGHLVATTLYSAIVAAIVWMVLRLFRRVSPPGQLALWALVMVRLLLPAGLAQPFSARAALDGLQTLLAGSSVVERAGSEPDFVVVAGAGQGGAEVRTPFRNVESLLLAGWVCGTLLFTALYLLRLRRYRRTARQARAVDDPLALELAQRWRGRFRIRRPVRLVAVAGASPFTIGLWRPRIVLPQGLLEAGCARELEPVIAHEMAHIRRGDAVWLLMQNLLQAAYFFHPAVWIASLRIHAARESVCDGMVLAWRTIPVAQYGRSLLAVLRAQSHDLFGTVSGMSLTTRQWKNRLKNLQGDHDMKRNRFSLPLLGAMVLGFLLLPMAAWTTDDAPVPPAPPTPPPAVRLSDPLPGAHLTSAFGWRVHPLTKKKDFHSGIDLAAPAGTEVRAAGAGIVEQLELDKTAERGMTVTIGHGDGRQTFYAYLQEVTVTLKQAVKPGQVIGRIGAVGRSTGTHLHFQVMQTGRPVDPQPLLQEKK